MYVCNGFMSVSSVLTALNKYQDKYISTYYQKLIKNYGNEQFYHAIFVRQF